MQAPQPAVLLRIYTEEGKTNDHRPLYEDIVMKARAAKLAGATVLRGPMGYGLHSVVHTAKILDLSAKLPLIIEIVDAEEKNSRLPGRPGRDEGRGSHHTREGRGRPLRQPGGGAGLIRQSRACDPSPVQFATSAAPSAITYRTQVERRPLV